MSTSMRHRTKTLKCKAVANLPQRACFRNILPKRVSFQTYYRRGLLWTWMPPLLPAGKLVPPLTTAGTRIPPLATAGLSLNRQYERRDRLSRRERGCTADRAGGTRRDGAMPPFLLTGHANVAVPPLPPAEHLDGT